MPTKRPKQIMSRPMHLPHLLVLGYWGKNIFTESQLWEIEKDAKMVECVDLMATKHTGKDCEDEYTFGTGLDGLTCIAVYRDWWENLQRYKETF